ncbi:hypothetical protein ABT095_33640 [Kitasatospora sp. NPDC002227]|uniref:hypothetical protein n=1 Tax=Kitasatospora sp. NPDC002227 TaxID=3154773 RepID=UPI0033233D56
MPATPHLAHLAAAGAQAAAPQQFHISVVVFLGLIVLLLVWKAGHKWWHALLALFLGLSLSGTTLGNAANGLMGDIVGAIGSIHI